MQFYSFEVMNRSDKTEMINYRFTIFTAIIISLMLLEFEFRVTLNFSIEMKLAYISISNNKIRNNTQIVKSSYSSNKKLQYIMMY